MEKILYIWWWMLTILCNHSAIYKNIKSLCCVSETNTMMDANYTSIKKKNLPCKQTHNFVHSSKHQQIYPLYRLNGTWILCENVFTSSGKQNFFRKKRTVLLLIYILKFILKVSPLEQEMATHSSIVAWKVSRTEEPCGAAKSWTRLSTHACLHKWMYFV